MIWPFRPHPPLPLASKVACERRFAAIGTHLGKQRISSHAVVTPQDIDPVFAECDVQILPRRLFDFVAGRMLSNRSIDIDWGKPAAMVAAGRSQYYDLAKHDDGTLKGIVFHPSLAEFPYRLAAITAIAAAESLVFSESSAENVPTGACEIVPLFFGFGPIMANAALHETVMEANGVESWEMSRIGTVSPLEFGYTMALADWSIASGYEDITTLLRPDAKEGLEKGGRFLNKTSDCCFERDFLERSPDNSVGFVASRLNNRSPSVQLSTLTDLYHAGEPDAYLIPGVADLLGHSETDIQKLATVTLGRWDSLPQPIHDELLILAETGPPAVRRAAVSSLRPGFDNDDTVLETVTDLLSRSDATMAATCVQTLLKYETHPEHLPDSLMTGLSRMVLTLSSEDLMPGIELLRRVHADPLHAVQHQFEEDPTALAIFHELMEADCDV